MITDKKSQITFSLSLHNTDLHCKRDYSSQNVQLSLFGKAILMSWKKIHILLKGRAISYNNLTSQLCRALWFLVCLAGFIVL